MLKAISQTRAVNRFKDDAVVPASKLMRKYGKSLPTGYHLTDGKTLSDIYGSSSSVIDKLVSSQNYVANKISERETSETRP